MLEKRKSLKILSSLLGLVLVAWPLLASANAFLLDKRAFPVLNAGGLIGTSFRICQPNLVLTAAHVVHGYTPADVSILISLSPAIPMTPVRIEKHPQADVAALFFDEAEMERAGLECFRLGVPSKDYPGASDYSMGEDTRSYGFPQLEIPTRPRTMKGHIQSHFLADGKGYEPYRYWAYELAFPSFPGLSGAPVCREESLNDVIAIVTASTRHARSNAQAYWAIGVALPALAEWLESLAPPAPPTE